MHSPPLSRCKTRELGDFANLAFYRPGGRELASGFRLGEFSEHKSRLACFQSGNYYYYFFFL